jgi:hypothetical protein
MRQVGKALSILAMHEAKQLAISADLAAFHAPGECAKLAFKNSHREERQARRHAKSVSGLNRRQFRLVEKRSWRWIERATTVIFNRIMPGY